jgi:hypothetical protein
MALIMLAVIATIVCGAIILSSVWSWYDNKRVKTSEVVLTVLMITIIVICIISAVWFN